jgi:hypothetical protein
MSPRAQQLHKTADCQIAELTQRLSTAGGQGLTRPCPSRERLGDGTVGAVAAHATDNYQRIARFVAAIQDGGPQHHSDVQHHHPGQHAEGDRASEIELDVLLARLAAALDALATIGQLSDKQLDSIPPAGEMKFADGQRTLEQIVASLLKHQRHQVTALTAELS